MTSHIDSRVRAANPVLRSEDLDRLFGDDASDRLLRDIRKERVAIMPERHGTNEQGHPELAPSDQQQPRPSARRGWLVAAGVAVTVLLVGGIVAATGGGDSPDVAATIAEAPATTATPATTSAPADPVEVVMATIGAYNAGDMDGWLDHFSEDAIVSGTRKQDLATAIAPGFAAGAQRNTPEPCRAVETNADGATTVECDHVETNEFHDAAGIVHTFTSGYVVEADGLISFASGAPGDYRTVTRYESVFWFWLEETYPDVFAQIGSDLEAEGTAIPGQGGEFPETVADMLIALEYVDEFVEQAADYPIVPGDE